MKVMAWILGVLQVAAAAGVALLAMQFGKDPAVLGLAANLGWTAALVGLAGIGTIGSSVTASRTFCTLTLVLTLLSPLALIGIGFQSVMLAMQDSASSGEWAGLGAVVAAVFLIGLAVIGLVSVSSAVVVGMLRTRLVMNANLDTDDHDDG
ncbi:MAG: hypothetical protein GC159_16460 [Phycisphaera sp.]|nr:hypothetical protein [Phycisphaera sp.]